MTERLTIRRPDDWHVHLRDGAMLEAVAHHTARQFARAIVMPNLSPPVTTSAMAAAYRACILAALPPGNDFTPLMTLYLTDDIDPDEFVRGVGGGMGRVELARRHHTVAVPAHGVTDIARIVPAIEAMQ